ncbi:MAG: hypothetical protein AB7O97_16165 [Planctomycetota bacterium]
MLLAALGACTTPPRENSFHRSVRAEKVDRLQLVREQQERDEHVLRAAILEDHVTLQHLRDAAALAGSRRRDAELAHEVELRQLAAATAELAATQERTAAQRAELDRVRSALAEIELKQLKLQALREQQLQLDGQIAAAERALAAQAAEVEPKVQALQARLQAARALQVQLDAALQQLDAMATGAQPTENQPQGEQKPAK